MTKILGADGRPLSTISQPRTPMDVATKARVPMPGQRWAAGVGRISPDRVQTILRNAAFGDTEAYLTLAVEMEERYLHYSSQLATRKLAVVGQEIEVTPGDESTEAATVAEAFEQFVVNSQLFHDMLLDLLDSLSKGYAVVQPYWDTTTRPWTFREFEYIDPRLFVFDRSTLREIRMRDSETADGQPFPSQQFIIHTPKIRTGVTCRGGLARPAAIAWMFQSATVAQWAAFAEVYGMPLRIGKYDPATSSDAEIEELKSAIVNIGHDAAAVLPNSMDIEIEDARRPTSGDNIFSGLADYWDKQISKLILGQTMTADDGASLSQAKVHNDVRVDISKADATALEATIYRQIAVPWTAFNYGPSVAAPSVHICVEPPEDLTALSLALAPLLTAGLRVSARELREKFSLGEPEDDEEVVGGLPELEEEDPGASPAKPPARRGAKAQQRMRRR